MKLLINKNIKLVLNYLLSLIIVLLIASILITIQGSNPMEAILAIVNGAIGSKAAIASSIRWSIPVIISSMAAIVAHKSGINNLGLDGQIYFGALSAAIAGAFIQLPSFIHIIFCILVGGIFGAIFAIIPALLKSYLKINEMVVTLMFNYIAVLLTEFITLKLMGLGASTNPDLIATPEILESAKLTKIMPPYQASTGIFVGLILFLLVFIFYKFTKSGYEWKMIGFNQKFAKYGGVDDNKTYFKVFLTSAFIAGICGSIEILGPHMRFRANFAQNLGWDGIMVALIGKNNPVATLVFSIVWGMVKAGSLSMERTTSVNRIIVTLVQALFVLFVTVDFSKMFKDIKRKISNKNKKAEDLV
jgi:simple sugar transport system permease protein